MRSLSPSDAVKPTRLSWQALVALGRLGSREVAHSGAVAGSDELAEHGIAHGRLVTAPWQQAAETLADPVGRARLVQRTREGVRTTLGWIGPTATVLATEDGEGRHLVATVPGGDAISLLFARLTGLGPRHPPPDVEPLVVSTSALEDALGSRVPPEGPLGPVARAWQHQWRAAVAWHAPSGGVFRDGCDVVDTGGVLWLVEPSGAERVTLGPVGPDVVWRRLLSLVPADPLETPQRWRTCRLPGLDCVVDVPASWVVRPGHGSLVATPGDERSATLRVVPGAARTEAPEEWLDRIRAALDDAQLVDTSDDELGGRPACRHLYYHDLGGRPAVGVAWVSGADPIVELVCSASPSRFLDTLDTFARIAASVGFTNGAT